MAGLSSLGKFEQGEIQDMAESKGELGGGGGMGCQNYSSVTYSFPWLPVLQLRHLSLQSLPASLLPPSPTCAAP